jgi:thiamine biosynthesis lipoprotein
MVTLLFSSDNLKTSVRVAMGTYVTVKAPSEALINRAFGEIDAVDAAFSTYKKSSAISRLNANKRIVPDAAVYALTHRAMAIGEMTGGYFDITVGTVTKGLYRFGEENETLPSQAALAQAALAVDYRSIRLTKKLLELPDHVLLDFGGIAKGYAVDRAAAALAPDTDEAVIAASGDIRCLHRCDVGVSDPHDPERTILNLKAKMPNLAFSTSGTYRRFVADAKHNHLIDPHTGKSQTQTASITLITVGDNTLIDALSTACGAMEPERMRAFLNGLERIAFIVVLHDGRVIRSANLPLFVEVVQKQEENKPHRPFEE